MVKHPGPSPGKYEFESRRLHQGYQLHRFQALHKYFKIRFRKPKTPQPSTSPTFTFDHQAVPKYHYAPFSKTHVSPNHRNRQIPGLHE